MRFKLDENLPVELADMFREAGHDEERFAMYWRNRWTALAVSRTSASEPVDSSL